MPQSRWLQPLFFVGAALGFVAGALCADLLDASVWLTLLLAWFSGAFVGLRFVGLWLCRFPDAKYLTPDKEDGMGFVWSSADVVVPYFIVGALSALMMLVAHLTRR